MRLWWTTSHHLCVFKGVGGKIPTQRLCVRGKSPQGSRVPSGGKNVWWDSTGHACELKKVEHMHFKFEKGLATQILKANHSHMWQNCTLSTPFYSHELQPYYSSIYLLQAPFLQSNVKLTVYLGTLTQATKPIQIMLLKLVSTFFNLRFPGFAFEFGFGRTIRTTRMLLLLASAGMVSATKKEHCCKNGSRGEDYGTNLRVKSQTDRLPLESLSNLNHPPQLQVTG